MNAQILLSPAKGCSMGLPAKVLLPGDRKVLRHKTNCDKWAVIELLFIKELLAKARIFHRP